MEELMLNSALSISRLKTRFFGKCLYFYFYVLAVGAALLQIKGLLRFDHTNALQHVTSSNMNDVAEHMRMVDKILHDNRLSITECFDLLSVADPKRSTIEFIGSHIIYVGDLIRLKVILFDGYGQTKFVGGDHLRARLYNTNTKAYTAGLVTDHENGTYTVNIVAAWSGTANIEIELLYPREIISTLLRLRDEWNFRGIRAGFRYSNYTEETVCNSDDLTLQRSTGRTNLCRLFYWNNTMPWYCVKPVNENLTCSDWVYTKRSWADYTNNINTCENHLAKRDMFTIDQVKSVTIFPSPASRKKVIDLKNIPCTSYNTTKLWFNREPSGFFYHGKWNLFNCKGESSNIGECLRNGAVYLWGDSTLRQWIKILKNRFNTTVKCNSSITGTEQSRWKYEKQCFCKQYNVKLKYIPHNIPVASGNNLHSYYNKALQEVLRSDKDIRKRIVILHLYSHLLPNSLKFFAAHMFAIRMELEKILSKEPETQVFIKLPHTHREVKHDLWQLRQPDYLGYLYTSIIRRLFYGLYDKIIVLNNNDATNAVKSIPLHPASMVVSAMVDQFLNYICNAKNEYLAKSSV